MSFPPLSLIDVEYRFARKAPVAQLGTDLREVAPALLDELRLKGAVGDERHQQCEIGREALLGLRGEIGKALNTRVRMLGEVAKADLCRLTRQIAEDDDRSLCLDMRDRRGERRPARRFEDQSESSLCPVDALDDLVGATQMPSALAAADHGGIISPPSSVGLGGETFYPTRVTVGFRR